MFNYKYETHAHTSEVSICGKISAKDLVRFYKTIGFDGLFITDHFITGTTRVPKELPWEERVNLFCSGYETALVEGKRIGIDVFFGFEHTYQGTDFLIYGLDKKWLLMHPEIDTMDINTFCDYIRDAGGFIVHAHPFREAGYIKMIRLLPRKVDAVETYNACRTEFENQMADRYADNYGLLKLFGSDNHVGQLKRLGGILTKEPITKPEDLIRAIVKGNIEKLVMEL